MKAVRAALMILVVACTHEETHRQPWCSTLDEKVAYVECIGKRKAAGDWSETAESICKQLCPERWTTCRTDFMGIPLRCWYP